MMRAMLDSNAFDQFLIFDDAVDALNDLTRRGLLVIVTTHVQRDELGAITRDPEKRVKLLAIMDRLVMTEVPTDGGIWGTSKWGASKWGDGTGTLRISDIMTTNPKHAEDALIAITAGAEADLLVTEERDLPNKIKRKTDRPEVLTFAQFMERMRTLA
jgi:predicted nucleic acid-binding protein